MGLKLKYGSKGKEIKCILYGIYMRSICMGQVGNEVQRRTGDRKELGNITRQGMFLCFGNVETIE